MLIRRPADIPSSEITSEDVYLNRRQFLERAGVVTAGMMLRKFKYALLAIIVIAAIITPSSDPVNLAVFTAPMLALYVLSIGVAWLFGKKRPVED